MSAVNRKKLKLAEARALYAAGAGYAEIAASLDVPAGSVRRWASEERRAGREWTRQTIRRAAATAGRSRTVQAAERSAQSQSAQPVSDETESLDPPKDRADLCRRLERRLGLLVVGAEGDLDDAKVEERFLKLCRVLESLRGDTADLDAQLEAMRRFADFCVQNLTEEEMVPVRGPIRQFVDYLKEEHS